MLVIEVLLVVELDLGIDRVVLIQLHVRSLNMLPMVIPLINISKIILITFDHYFIVFTNTSICFQITLHINFRRKKKNDETFLTKIQYRPIFPRTNSFVSILTRE